MNRSRLLPVVLLPLMMGAVSCTRIPDCMEVYGADQFVIDSYQIRQGKFSILALEGKPRPRLDPSLTREYADRIANDDVLEIALFHPSRTDLVAAVNQIGRSVGYRVTEGAVTLPDLNPIAVAGLSLSEAREKIEADYAREIQDVEVFLAYRERLTKKVELAGMVNLPSLPVDGKVRLFEVLAKARVPDSANLFKSYVVRSGVPLSVDLYRLVHEGDMSQNIVMRGGDKIFIAAPLETTAMVMGEVGRPKLIPLPSGTISLREALVSAGGIQFTGNKQCIQVIRGNITSPRVYTLNWHHIIHLPNDSLLLMPGDTVYVTARPITEWNRFISQLLPSFAGLFQVSSALSLVGAVQ